MNHTLPIIQDQVFNKNPIKSVCVFCGSANGSRPSYAAEAKEIGRLLAQNEMRLVYGGGSVGLMGEVARGVLENGGNAIGIVPEPLYKHGSKQIAETIIVPDMHARKKRMADESDAFLVLPGGFGTMEEMLEMVTWSQLNIHSKPIVLVNTDGYYKMFVEWIKMCIQEGFVNEKNSGIFITCDTASEVIEALHNYVVPRSRYSLEWSNDNDESLV